MQWNNSTLKRQLRYVQPNLGIVSLSAQRLSERTVLSNRQQLQQFVLIPQ
jgi:hypothetical protein